MATQRSEPTLTAGERDMLTGWLDYHRATLVQKCEGLSDEQLRERSVPPSNLSLLGLVRHLTECEVGWFREVLLGEEVPGLYWSPENPTGDFNDLDSADTASVFEAFERECTAAREAIASLINDGYITAQVVPPSVYPKGSGPQLPPLNAIPRSNPASPMWCPVAWFAIPSAFEDDAQ